MLLGVVAITLFSLSAFADSTTRLITITDKEREKAAASMPLNNPEMRKRAEEMMNTLQSEQWQQRYHQATQSAAVTVGVEAPPVPGSTSTVANEIHYLFISSSMPLEVLQRYAKAAERRGGVTLVLRGFVGGGTNIKPTARFIRDVLLKDPFCKGATCQIRRTQVVIDPLLFRELGINRVPALAVASNRAAKGYCADGIPTLDPINSQKVVYGDASLNYLLETLEKI